MLLAPGTKHYLIVIMVLNYEIMYTHVDTMNSTFNLYEPHNKTN